MVNTAFNKKLVIAITSFSAILSCIVLIGWFLGLKEVLYIIPGSATMKFNTALLFLLSSVIIYSKAVFKKNASLSNLVLCIILGGISTITLLEYTEILPFSIDELLIKDNFSTIRQGRMSPATSFSFLLFGLGLYYSQIPKISYRTISNILFLAVAALSYISICAYALKIPTGNKSVFFDSMAIHTSVLFALLTFSAALNNPKKGIINFIFGKFSGNRLIKGVLAILLVLPLLLSFVLIKVVGLGIFPVDFGVVLYTIILTMIFIFYFSKLALKLNRLDKERIQLEDLLKTRNMELEQFADLASKELDQFAYIAAHDLQEPLMTIGTGVDILNKEYAHTLKGDGLKFLTFITEATDKMKAMVKGLLDYSRIGNETEMKKVDSGKIVEAVLQDFSEIISQTNSHINVAQMPIIIGLETELRQLFQNLIDNALKFRRVHVEPIIDITVNSTDGFWQFSISDNGIGIPEKYLEKVFVIFQRLHTKEEFEGSGIGLAHCQKIVHLHQGKIWADSEPHKKTSFHFTIKQFKNDQK